MHACLFFLTIFVFFVLLSARRIEVFEEVEERWLLDLHINFLASLLLLLFGDCWIASRFPYNLCRNCFIYHAFMFAMKFFLE